MPPLGANITFTAFLKDQFTSVYDKFVAKSNKAGAALTKDLAKVHSTGKQVSLSLGEINKRLDSLQRTRKASIDVSAIKAANKEISQLMREKARLEGMGSRSGGGGGAGMLGGLGKGFLVGAAGYLTVDTLANIADKATEATAKYERFEAVLSNTLGSRGAAQQVMGQISDFASKTPFQVDELTSSFVKLANQGFKPNQAQMTSLGDLAASTGKSYDQLTEAIIDAQTGEFERLKEFGIRASKEGNKVSFTFKEQSKTVDFTAGSIRNYILSLGQAQGVSGAMAKISETTGGQISNLSDNVDLLWKGLGERFKPEIQGSIGLMSSFVATARSWIEIPTSQKLQDEVNKLKGLQTELNTTNLSENRRKELLEQIKQINPDLVSGLEKEKDQYGAINNRLDEYIRKKKEIVALTTIKEKYSSTLNEYSEASTLADESYGQVFAALAQIDQPFVNDNSLSLTEKIKRARAYLKPLAKTESYSGGTGGASFYQNEEGKILTALDNSISRNVSAHQTLRNLSGQKRKYDADMGRLNKLLGDTTPSVISNTQSGKSTGLSSKTKGDSAGIGSMSEGSQVKNIVININNLVNGGVNLHTTNVREGMNSAKDIVTEALLTAVNDANLAGS